MKHSQSYMAIHRSVYRERGKASTFGCTQRNNTCRGRMEWANISGEYLDVDDFMPLCRSHHLRYDFNLHVGITEKMTAGLTSFLASLSDDENASYRAKRQATRIILHVTCATVGCTIRPYGGRDLCGSCREGRPVGYRNRNSNTALTNA
jgi:hypothetical protein